jgi:indolepyruvate ferredoxin oxidoreductase
LPEPVLPALDQPYNVLVTGVGGTGVVTIGALMGMAAHIEGKGVLVLDMAGLAQKGGAVMSHVRLAADPSRLYAARVAGRQADLVLGCDLMVAAGKDALGTMDAQRTRAVMNTDVAPTGAFTQNPNWEVSTDALLAKVQGATRETATLEASRLATALMGDAVATNVFLLGYAWQKGWIPLLEASLMQAIQLNGAAVEMNRNAFAWGRQAALDLAKVQAAAGITTAQSVVMLPAVTPPLETILASRKPRLVAYQNAAYAARYERFVREIAAAEKERTGGDRLAREVAVSLYKLMAYKDEYEVARLYSETGFFNKLALQFEGDYQLRFHLAPPLFSKRDAQGHLVKKAYGPWIANAFKLLAKARFLRGTALDVFGYTEERRRERAAIGAFQQLMKQVVQGLNKEQLATAVALARLPQEVRGYGHVKDANEATAHGRQVELLARMQAPAAGNNGSSSQRQAA